MNANEIITVTFTDNLTRQTIIIDMAQPEYIAILDKVIPPTPVKIQDDAIGLGIYTVVVATWDDVGCCDDCGAQSEAIWCCDDSAGWLCEACLIAQAIADTEEEQAFRSAEQNAGL